MNFNSNHENLHLKAEAPAEGLDSLSIMERPRVPPNLFELLFEVGKRQGMIIEKMADAVRRNDPESVFQLAVELTRNSPPNAF